MEHLIEHLTFKRCGAFYVFSDGTRLPVVSGGDGEPTPAEQLLADLQSGAVADAETLNARLAALSPEQLAAFEQSAVGLFDAIIDGSVEVEEGADRLEVLDGLANAIDATRAETGRRDEAAAAEQARLEEMRTRVHGTEGEPPTEGEGTEGAEGETEPPAEGQTEPAPPANEPEPVSAAAPPAIRRVAVRRQPDQPRSPQRVGQSTIVAAADVPGYGAGAPIPDFSSLTRALSDRADVLRRTQIGNGSTMSLPVATIRADYPEDRDLRRVQRNAVAVEQAITASLGANHERLVSLTAAGGFCAPPTTLYDQISIAEADRPLRGALPSFQAGRGRVTFMPSPTWTDYTGGVRVWTGTNDTEALTNANVRKPCVRVDCDDTTTVEVYAIPVCVTVGNFFDRTYDERREAIMQGVMAWQARFAERELLQRLADNSTTVTTGQTLGTTRDVLAILDRAIAGFFSRYRVGDGFRLEYMAPRWLRNMMRADLVRALPSSGASLEENLAVADATLNGFLTARGLNVTWLWDGERGGTNQEFGAEGGAALQNWPTNVIQYLFHPGAHRFLDGGELNIGVQRDSTLNATNDLQIWGETFEGLMSPGLESLRIDSDVCPSGEIAGTTDVTGIICTTGS